MAGCLIIEDRLTVPLTRTLQEFCEWALSDGLPESGRFDFIDGNIEIDRSPELIFTHNAPKVAIVARLVELSHTVGQGYVFCSRMRFSSIMADLSAQPDVFFLSYDTLDRQLATLTPSTDKDDDGYVEIEGALDLVVEIITDCSLKRDTNRLPRAYHRTGVREFWLVDARDDNLQFRLHRRGPNRFMAQPRDDRGFQTSQVFGRRFRFDRSRDERGNRRYNMRYEGEEPAE